MMNMKKVFLSLLLALGVMQSTHATIAQTPIENAAQLQTQNSASLTIDNRSDYRVTVKVMRTNGRGLYQVVYLAPYCSTTIYFSSSDSFFAKSKADKGCTTLYKMGSSFSVRCDNFGYSQATLAYYVSGGNGGAGRNISKSEFERNQ